MPTGSASVVFSGVGKDYASVDVVGQTGLSASSHIEAYVMAEASSDRTADDNRIDPVRLLSEYLSATSFRIHADAVLGTITGTIPVRWATVA